MITILTLPVGFLGILMRIRRFFFGFFYEGYAQKYGGHQAVTRSLVKGLERNNEKFNYNPIIASKLGETVVVLNNVFALKQMINLKKKGKVKKLLAGPNVIHFPSEFNHLMASKEINVCLVPSEPVKITHEEDSPNLIGRIGIWPAGADEEYWKPDNKSKKADKALVYWKNAPADLNNQVEVLLKEMGWEVTRIVYGQYSPNQFKEALNNCQVAVFLSRNESQGIALLESWAMNVPTLVWNPQNYVFKYKNKSVVLKSSAPYLNDSVGRFWKELTDLRNLLENFNNFNFSPRKWVLENLTDSLSTKKLVAIIQKIKFL